MLMNPSLGKIWCVAQIKNNLYDTAIQNLKRQGFETFLPKMKITKEKKQISYQERLCFSWICVCKF